MMRFVTSRPAPSSAVVTLRDELVFATVRGTPRHESNLNRRVWRPAVMDLGVHTTGSTTISVMVKIVPILQNDLDRLPGCRIRDDVSHTQRSAGLRDRDRRLDEVGPQGHFGRR